MDNGYSLRLAEWAAAAQAHARAAASSLSAAILGALMTTYSGERGKRCWQVQEPVPGDWQPTPNRGEAPEWPRRSPTGASSARHAGDNFPLPGYHQHSTSPNSFYQQPHPCTTKCCADG